MFNSEGIELVNPGITGDYKQEDAVYEAMSFNFNRWLTLSQISDLTGIPSESSIASRIRDLRTHGHNIPRRQHPNASGGTRIFEYRLA